MTILHKQLALGIALTLGAIGTAGAVTAGSAAAAPVTQTAEPVTTGVISSIDTAKGLLVVAGRLYRFKPGAVSFSDDRRKPGGGIEGLKPGSKVTVQSVTRDGGNQAVRIIAKD